MTPLSVYAPILKELRGVDECLEATAQADLRSVADILKYILRKKGKRIRPALTLLSGKLFEDRGDLLVPMATAVELLHTATLVHDDTIDNAHLRRGQPTASALWNSSVAVLAGDYLFAQSARLVASLGNLRVIKLFAHTLMSICTGEIEESLDTYNYRLTREQYLQRIANKTASLFAAATESGAILSSAADSTVISMRRYGHNLGIVFQIVDDILDFIGEEDRMGKPVASDLQQGTLTLPALLLLERYPQDNPVIALFQKREEQENLRRAIEMVRHSDIIEQCYRLATDFAAASHHYLQDLPQTPCRESLAKLVEYAVSRKE